MKVSEHPTLSERQVQIARGICAGKTNQEIADELRISKHTVAGVIRIIFAKFGVTTRVELALRLVPVVQAAAPLSR